MKKYDIGLSIFFSMLGLTVLYLSKDLNAGGQGFGAGTWPKFLGILLVFLSVLLLLQTLFKKNLRRNSPEEDADAEKSKKPIEFTSAGMKRVYLVILILVVYSLMQEWVGFYIACGVMLPLVMLVMGVRRPLALFTVTGGVILAVYLIFGLILHTPLPQGILF